MVRIFLKFGVIVLIIFIWDIWEKSCIIYFIDYKWVGILFLFERLEVSFVIWFGKMVFNDSFLRVWVMKLNFGCCI